jgi:hypothetical protein
MKMFSFAVLLILFYLTGNAQTVNVMGYERQTTLSCLEDWIENNSSDYAGAYTFIHFGHHTYIFTVKKDVVVVEENFMSLSREEHSVLKNVKFDKNIITATDESGREFKGRFVNLKCNIDSEFLSGFHALLIDEELLYVMEGD